MGNITLTGTVRLEKGIPVVRRMVVPKNKYSSVYKEHKDRKEEGKTYDI